MIGGIDPKKWIPIPRPFATHYMEKKTGWIDEIAKCSPGKMDPDRVDDDDHVFLVDRISLRNELTVEGARLYTEGLNRVTGREDLKGAVVVTLEGEGLITVYDCYDALIGDLQAERFINYVDASLTVFKLMGPAKPAKEGGEQETENSE